MTIINSTDLFNKLNSKYTCSKYEINDIYNIYFTFKPKVKTYIRLTLKDNNTVIDVSPQVYYTGKHANKLWITQYIHDAKIFINDIAKEASELINNN